VKKNRKKHVAVFLIAICMAFGIVLPSSSMEENEASPNYLIILVHGINSSSRVFVGQDKGGGKGSEGSDLTYEPKEKDDFGDIKGYLENNLGLKTSLKQMKSA